MIIFYSKTTGEITGTIDGRIHNDDHLKMWVGTKVSNGRIVVNWIPTKWYNKEGEEVEKDDPTVYTADFVPETQQDIFEALDKNPSSVYNYRVDIISKQLVLKEQSDVS